MSAWRSFGGLRTWLSKIAPHRLRSRPRADSRQPRIAAPLPARAPAPTDPAPTDPAPTDPAATDPAPTDPAQPAPAPSPPEPALAAPAVPEPARAAPVLAAPALPEPTGAGDAPPWLEPYPDHLLDHLPGQKPRPKVRYDSTQAISLGFITALQQLPPRQRAALVLCDVVGYDAAEVAQMLDTTSDVINSALTRARVTVDSHLADCGSGSSRGDGDGGADRPARRLDPAAVEQRLVGRFIDALERADLEALIDLLDTDVKLSMPPAMLEYRGVDSARRVFAAVAFRYGRSYRVVPTRANGQPAFGLYLADPHASVYRAYALLVITTAGDLVTAITAFNTTIMARFGLPRTLPETD